MHSFYLGVIWRKIMISLDMFRSFQNINEEVASRHLVIGRDLGFR